MEKTAEMTVSLPERRRGTHLRRRLVNALQMVVALSVVLPFALFCCVVGWSDS
jgi:GTP cyclohydrolase FolE2